MNVPKGLAVSLIALGTLACDPPDKGENTPSPLTKNVSEGGEGRSRDHEEISRMVAEVLADKGKTEEELEREERVENIHNRLNKFIEEALNLFKETKYPHNSDTPKIIDAVLSFYNKHFAVENPTGFIVFAKNGDLPKGVGAAYVPDTKTIELSSDFDSNNEFDLSVLLHEVIHAWQYHKFVEQYGEDGLKRVLKWEHEKSLTSLEHEVRAIITQIEVLNLHSKDYMRSASLDRVSAFQSEGIPGLERLEPLQVANLAKKLKVKGKDQSSALQLFLKYAMNYYADPAGPKTSLEKVPRSFINNVAAIYNSLQGAMYEYIPKTDSQVDNSKKGDQIIIGDGIYALQLKDGYIAIYSEGSAEIVNTDELLR